MNGWSVGIGLLLTMAGIWSVVSDSPVICIGALIFGPILVLYGLAEESSTVNAHKSSNAPPPPSFGGGLSGGNSGPIISSGGSIISGPPPTIPPLESGGKSSAISGPRSISNMEIDESLKNLCSRHGYSIDGFIARGGMSEIYSGIDMNGRNVIIKFARGYRKDEEKSDSHPNPHKACVEFLRREGEFLQKLDHKNIVKVYDLLDAGNDMAIVEEFIEGPTLYDYVKTIGALPIDRAYLIGTQMLDVLSYIHLNMGYAFRDLHPKNILIDGDRLVLIDFGGIAKIGTYATHLEMGAYHIPRNWLPQNDKGEVFVREYIDIYSFSNTLYFVLTGLKPLKDEQDKTWKVMKHEMEKRNIPDLYIDAIHKGRSLEIKTAPKFRRYFEALSYGAVEICGICKEPLPAGSNFCTYCGSFKCTNCSSWVEPGSKFCGNCGFMFCTNCGRAIPPDSSVCPFCGNVLK